MTTIQLTKHNKNKLKNYGSGSIDKIINQLIDDVENHMNIINEYDSPSTTIRVSETTVDRLNSYKLTTGESYENIILRMLLLSKTLNITSE